MSDNVTAPGEGAVFKTDEVSGAHIPYSKIDIGANNASSPLVGGQQTSANSISVVPASDAPAMAVSVSGGATAANQATEIAALATLSTHVDGVEAALSPLATSAKQDTLIGHVDGIETALGSVATTTKQDTGNASLASIDTKTPALGQALSAASSPVVLPAAQITALTPPAAITGFATSAKQDDIIGHVNGVETLLTAIDGHVDGAEGLLTTLAGAVAGSEMQVDVITSALPTGASTGAKQDTGNTSLSSIDGKLATAKTADFDTGGGTDTVQMVGMALPKSGGAVAGGTATDPIRTDPTGSTTQPVSASSLPLPSGAATSANQATVIGHLDGVEGLLGTIDADTGNISTKIDTIAGAVSGNEVQVDVLTLPALPAGSNNIGDVDVLSIAAGDNNIGNVDIVTVPADPFGANADAAATAGSTGSIQAKLRLITSQLDAIKTSVEALDNTVGGSELQVDVVSSALPTGAATETTLASILTELGQKTEPANQQHVIVDSGAGLTDAQLRATPVPVSGTVSVSGNVEVTNDSGNPLDVAVLSVIPGSTSTALGKAEDAAHSSGNVGVMALSVRQNTAAATSDTDGDYQPLITDTNGRLHTLDGNSAAQLTALQLIDDPVVADDAAFAPGTTKVMMAGFEADESSTDSIDEGDAGAARMTLDRKQIVNPQPHTAGGLSIFKSIDIDETEEDVKTSPGNLYGYYIFNAAASVRYVKFYNDTAANVVVGTTAPVMTLPIPAGSAANLMATHGITFSVAICVAATTGVADNDTGAPSANDCQVTIWYK
jgi:hypothetical protein